MEKRGRKKADSKKLLPADSVYRDKIKRILDCVLALFVIFAGAVPMGIVAAAIKLDSPGPVLFKQKRLGLGGQEFEIWKFRSMYLNAEHAGSGVYSGKEDDRVTRVGKVIRATSMDELPQVFNILRGEMSLVGPRPPLTYHPWPIEEYTKEQRKMFAVRPGITGWAQIHGRKDVEWHRRIELNNWYVDHVSFELDLKIFVKTIFKVLTNADNVNKGKTLQKDT
ncbi:MAG: sugar transferase [Lachnospiraceae bacterium]|nr:sugar transferase [Lachnospiraceae bacterium]